MYYVVYSNTPGTVQMLIGAGGRHDGSKNVMSEPPRAVNLPTKRNMRLSIAITEVYVPLRKMRHVRTYGGCIPRCSVGERIDGQLASGCDHGRVRVVAYHYRRGRPRIYNSGVVVRGHREWVWLAPLRRMG